jgi:outer membrane protein assembly factor BamA
VSAGGDISDDDTGPFVNTYLDYRLYRKATSRSLLALRLAGAVSNGDGFYVYSLGGLNQLRGYDFREFFGSRVAHVNLEYRFPLVDALAFPIGIIRNIRGFFFLDIGAAWFGNDRFFHPDLGEKLNPLVDGVVDPNTAFIDLDRRFDFWDSKNNKLGDGRAAYGFGWGFYLGPFQLTWSFARQFDNTVEVCDFSDGVCDPATDITRVDDPFQADGTVSTFYISREF